MRGKCLDKTQKLTGSFRLVQMICNIEKWYMRLLLTLAAFFIWFHLFISMVITLFSREAGFLNYQIMPMRYLNRFLEYLNIVDDDVFLGVAGIIFLIMMIGSWRWSHIFIWPVLAVNFFICTGSIQLVWRHYMQFSTHLSGPWGQLDEYDWVIFRGFFIFFSALFIGLLMPAAWYQVGQAKWSHRLFKNET